MRSFILLGFSLVFALYTYCQEDLYTQQSDSAWAQYNRGDFRNAQASFISLTEMESQNLGSDYFNVACCAALQGKSDLAINYLKLSLENGLWQNPRLFYNDTDLDSVRKDPRWPNVLALLETKIDHGLSKAKQETAKFEKHQAFEIDKGLKGQDLYESIINAGKFVSHDSDKPSYFCFWLAYDDTTSVPYLIQLPANYNPNKKYSLFYQLHGAIWGIENYPMILGADQAGGFNRFVSKYALETETILAIPMGTKYINWLYPDDGLDLIPKITAEIKGNFNIDDNKVFICGHSNGGSGSFSYAIKDQNAFAAFYGFNSNPKVYTGGTYILNLRNSSFHNVSTDADYYYPQPGNERFLELASIHNFTYTNDYYEGFPHWFPEFDESEAPSKKIMENTLRAERNPFANELYWECESTKHGKCHWLEIVELDTISSRKEWHKTLNFDVTGWRDIDDEQVILKDVVKPAFNFPIKSGAVIANYDNNVFTLKTSCVSQVALRISPQMVNLNKPVTIVINGKKQWEGKVEFNNSLIIQEFEQTKDRSAVWIDRLVLSTE